MDTVLWSFRISDEFLLASLLKVVTRVMREVDEITNGRIWVYKKNYFEHNVAYEYLIVKTLNTLNCLILIFKTDEPY